MSDKKKRSQTIEIDLLGPITCRLSIMPYSIEDEEERIVSHRRKRERRKSDGVPRRTGFRWGSSLSLSRVHPLILLLRLLPSLVP